MRGVPNNFATGSEDNPHSQYLFILIFDSWKSEPIVSTRLSPLEERRGTTLRFHNGILTARRREADFLLDGATSTARWRRSRPGSKPRTLTERPQIRPNSGRISNLARTQSQYPLESQWKVTKNVALHSCAFSPPDPMISMVCAACSGRKCRRSVR